MVHQWAANQQLSLQPMLVVMYFLNYIDRNTLAQTRLDNLEKELGMEGEYQFNTTISILFVGYVLMQIPSNMLITRIRPSIYMSSWMIIWSIVSGSSRIGENSNVKRKKLAIGIFRYVVTAGNGKSS